MAIKVNGTTVVNNDRKGEFNVTNPGQFTTAERDAFNACNWRYYLQYRGECSARFGTAQSGAVVVVADETKAPVIFNQLL